MGGNELYLIARFNLWGLAIMYEIKTWVIGFLFLVCLSSMFGGKHEPITDAQHAATMRSLAEYEKQDRQLELMRELDRIRARNAINNQ